MQNLRTAVTSLRRNGARRLRGGRFTGGLGNRAPTAALRIPRCANASAPGLAKNTRKKSAGRVRCPLIKMPSAGETRPIRNHHYRRAPAGSAANTPPYTHTPPRHTCLPPRVFSARLRASRHKGAAPAHPPSPPAPHPRGTARPGPYQMELRILCCSALASPPCSPGTRAGRAPPGAGVPASRRGGCPSACCSSAMGDAGRH